MFPPGTPGYGLLLLRMLVAASLHLNASGRLVQHTPIVVFAILLVLSTLLIAGLLTPLVAALSGAVEMLLLIIPGDASIPLGALVNPLDALLVVMLGPGAYSLDAHLFGRRVLVLNSSDPPSRR